MPFRIVETPLRPGALPELSPAGEGGVEALLAPALLAGKGAEAARRTLLHEKALVVTTGQQPGLFTGPLYTVYKAISAAALASELADRWQRPVVPVFWLAGDDHDFAEARGTSWLNLEGRVTSGDLAARPPDAPATPMYRLPLGTEIRRLLEEFEDDQPVSADRDTTMAWLRRHYQEGATVGAAYAGAMGELLGPFGVTCFDPTHPDARRAMAATLVAALRDSDEIDQALGIRLAELSAAGRPVSMTAGDGSTLVLLEAAAGRDRLIREGRGFRTRRSGEAFTLEELEAIAATEPQRLSPNVLLRPVVERVLLPTVAYVAGPGELNYLPLAEPVYRHLGVSPQQPVPRWSGLVIESRVDRVLHKFSSTVAELASEGHALERRVVRAQLPATVPEAAERIRASLDGDFGHLVQAATAIDPTIARSIESSRARALASLARAEKKLESALRRRESTEMGQIVQARDALLPLGKPQERVLGVATFMARHGPAFLGDVSSQIRDWYRRTLVATKPPS